MEKNRLHWTHLLVLPLVAVLLVASGAVPAHADPGSPTEMVEQAWRNAQDAGSYRFISDIEQRLIPRPVPEMIGQQETALALAIDGAVVLPDQAYMDLRLASAGRDESVAMLHDHGGSYMVQDGELKPVENALNLTSYTNDVLSYLAAAENVVVMSPPEGHAELLRYGFDVDGPRFAEHVRQRAEVQLQAQPGAPEGLTVKPSPVLQRLSGRGELWVNQQGLPVRQVLDIEMSEVNAQYDARIHLVANLSSYGQVESLPRAVQGTDGAWRLEGMVKTGAATSGAGGESPAPSGDTTPSNSPPLSGTSAGRRAGLATLLPLQVRPSDVMLFTLVLLIVLLSRYYRRIPRRCYTLIAWTLISIMIATPLLQAEGVVDFVERQARAAEARAAAVPDLLEALGLETENAQTSTDLGVVADLLTSDADASSAPAPLDTGLRLTTGSALPNELASVLQVNDQNSMFSRCGDLDSGVDTDGDGLDDAVELCLGTSRFSSDSDHDGIPDGVEIDGFEYDGKQWDSDPLKPDSNGDGVMDTLEWSSTLSENGQAANVDLDGDGIPNLWDDDDDGDDVPDAQDISPAAVTGYTTVASLSTEGGGFTGYQTIQIQIQPEEQAHLRYSTTGLDWPQDHKGNIQEHDDWNSHEDVRLSPFLIVTTNVMPDATLGAKYGFRSWVDGDHVTLMAPLYPVETGGAVNAFFAKVAYTPGQLADIQWQAEMVWIAQVDVDSTDLDVGFQTETTMAHRYQDSFRITGLEVAKEGGYEAMVLGTPEEADDVDLFRLLLGLSDTFKRHVKMEAQESNETALQEVAQRFAVGSTATLTHTFGVSQASVGVEGPKQYGLADAGMAGVGSELVTSFLEHYDWHYGSERCSDAEGNAVSCASLIVAHESSLGIRDLSDFPSDGSGTIDLGQLHVNLADVPLLTTRGVQMHMYEQRSDGWQITTPARMLELIEQRYKDDYATAMRDLYPLLESEHVRFMAYAAYLWATTSSYKAVLVDGVALVDEQADESQLALDRALDPALEAEATTAVSYWAMGTGIAGVVFSGIIEYGKWMVGDFAKFMSEHANDTSFSAGTAWDAFGVGLSVFCVGAAIIMGIIGAICDANSELPVCRSALALDIANGVVQGLKILSDALQMLEVIQKAIEGTLKAATTIAMTIAAVGVIIGIAASWVGFILTCVYGGLSNPIVWRNALASAIVSTVYAIVMFIIACIPVIGAIIGAIMAVLDGLFALFTWLFGGEASSIAAALLSIFYMAEVCTNVGEGSISFGEFSSGLADPDMGMVGGNTFRLSAPFEGVLVETAYGNRDDLKKSSIEGHLSGEYAYYEPEELAAIFPSEDMSDPPICEIYGSMKYCSNNAAIGYLLTPRINGIVPMQALVNYTIVWAEFGGAGAWRYSTHTMDGVLPEEIEYLKPDFTYLDILPVSLTDLWNWSALTNHDPDGDGLWNEQEAALGTSPNDWDSDGDGLSDAYEWQNVDGTGTDPLKADTDGDGLNDYLELRLGTFVNVADSDGDGLSDGEEVRRYTGSAMAGGWQITLSDGNAYWVSSDPLSADTDGDGLNDAEEKANGLSPNAMNQHVPSLSLSVTPVRGVPGGRAGAYWLPNEDVRIDIRLANGSPSPVTTTLTLSLPSWLENVQGGVMQGDGTASLTRNPGQLSWSFSGAEALQSYETVTTTVTARTSTSASGSGAIALSLPFGGVQMRKAFTATLDNDWPNVAILAPTAGSYLRGAGTTYVVGGAATDATTWITSTELSLVSQGSADSFDPLASTSSPWAYGWTLPSDGVYILKARATDVMNHVSTSASVTVTVDSRPPSATLTLDMVDGTARINGTATDNLAGVRSVQLSIDKQPWRSVPVSGTTWAYNWSVGEGAQGDHEVAVFAVDRSGNQSSVLTATITVDRVAPASTVNSGVDAVVPPAVKPNTSFDIAGVADEGGHLPLPSAPAELRRGMDVFNDSTVWLGLSSIHENDGGVLATWIGDFNADRLSDLAVGLPGPSGDAGQVAILYGRAGGWPTQPDLEMLAESPTHFIGTAGARLGSYVAAAGDVNGDTYADLLIGGRNSTRAFLIFGKPGPMGNVTLESGRNAYRVLLEAPFAIHGLASAGDVNGDGCADLLVNANNNPYLILGRKDPWPETIDVQAEAVANFPSVRRAFGLGDVDGDQLAEWVTVAYYGGSIDLYDWDSANNEAAKIQTFYGYDTSPRVAALGDVNGDGLADWIYTHWIDDPRLVYGTGADDAYYQLSNYDGFLAGPGDVDGDGRADFLLSDSTSGVASLIGQPPGQSTPQVFATISGVAGAANAPYAAGADVNSDGSSDLLLIPTQSAAEAHGFDAPDFSSGFVSPQSLPLGVSSASRTGDGTALSSMSVRSSMLGVGALSTTQPDTYYVDDDGLCDGNSPCYGTIQLGVANSDGGGDTVIVYPGVYDSFKVGPYAKNVDLTIKGVSPDAVFVEGTGTYENAIEVAAPGVRVSNLTVRQARAGIVLHDGGGEATVAGGSETVVDHILAHSVSYPISMTRASALTLSDSTLVGDGSHPNLYVNPGPSSVHTWKAELGLSSPITRDGSLVNAGGSLYALSGAGSGSLYRANPDANGALSTWSKAFSLYDAVPPITDPPTAKQGANLLAGSSTSVWQIHGSFDWPRSGGVANGVIWDIARDPATGYIYVGGEFTEIDDVIARHIAYWDGTIWHKVGDPTNLDDNGVDGPVYALDFVPRYNSTGYNLWIGGDFDYHGIPPVDDNAVGNLVIWTGSAWQTAGQAGWAGTIPTQRPANGVDGPVTALAHSTMGYSVFVGGTFNNAYYYDGPSDYVGAQNLVRYDNSGYNPPWANIGNVNGPVEALAFTNSIWHSGFLYVGGAFSHAGTVDALNVARWTYANGENRWDSLGTGVVGTIEDMLIDADGNLNVTTGRTAGDSGINRWNGSNWTKIGGALSYNMQALAMNSVGDVYAGGGDARIYVVPRGSDSPVLVGGTGPFDHEEGASWITEIRAMVVDSTDQLYTGFLGFYQNETTQSYHGALDLWTPGAFFQGNVPGGGWTRRPYPPLPTRLDTPADMVADAGNNLYAIWGEGSSGVLYHYDAASQIWSQRGSPPATITLKHLVWANGALYALSDGLRQVRYDPGTNSWTERAAPPVAPAAGFSWSWDGGDYIYALRGGDTNTFMRYVISANTWQVMPDPSVAFTVSNGPALARVGSYLYLYATPDSGVTSNVFRYGKLPAGDLRLTVDRTAFVIPESTATFAWTNLDQAAGNVTFQTDIDAGNVAVGRTDASWSPMLPSGTTKLSWAQADFVAPEDGLYRVGPDSQLTAGYHQYKATAHVYTSHAACSECAEGSLTWGVDAFATVREAVESGAARVLVHAGRYPQTFYLVSGVGVMGVGAESTIIEPPAGTGTLVTAEGAAGATLARLTLAGRAGWKGFLAEGGTSGLKLTRTVIRGFDTGVYLQEGSEVAVINNTLVRNANGLVAEGTNPVNVRNTIFAYSTGTGLQYGTSPTSLSNTYNDFWSNGTGISRGGQSDVSRGSLFVNPRFRDLAGNDLRLREDSPLIDAGAPGDPTLPGAGNRVDIGYAEYGAAGFYVSQDYSEAGLNDGLVWGVDAFDQIQPALDAAGGAMQDLQGAVPEGGYTVGVDTGTYPERVSVPSHVRLVGSGAEVSTLNAGGTGSAVTFDGVVDSALSGFTVQNAGDSGVEIKGGSSGITVERNVLAASTAHGVSLAGKSSAWIDFNTIVGNGGAGVDATWSGTWARVHNNIVAANAVGLQATSPAQVFNSYNLLHNTLNLSGVTGGEGTVTGDPTFSSGTHYVPSADSPAIDAAEPWAEVPPAGGTRADLGYKELIACPLTMFFGPEIDSTVTGNSGVAKVELGVVAVSDATQPLTATLPSTWQTLTPSQTGQPLFSWSQPVSQSDAGLYRVYSRATDEAGNTEEDESDWYEGAFVVDSTAPTVTWGTTLSSTVDAAAILAAVDAAGTVTTGSRARDDVKHVSFSVTAPSGSVTSYPAEDGQAWIPLPADGSYTISAIAVDEAGNQAQENATVAVSTSSAVATVTDPVDGSAVPTTTVTLPGYVRFVGTGTRAVAVAVDGTTVQATLDSSTAAFTTWSAPITLPTGDGAKTVTVTPSVDGAAGTVTTLSLTLDTVAPTLSVTTPADAAVVQQTISFAGTASDTGGLAKVEVSVDGGYTWRQAALNGGDWSLDWTLGLDQDYVSYPTQVRAVDAAGNLALEQRQVLVDNVSPSGLTPATFSQPVGQHFDQGDALQFTWNTPVDGSGFTKVRVMVNKVPEDVPPDTFGSTGNSDSVVLDSTGDQYVHLSAADASSGGNQSVIHYGPWHVRKMSGATPLGERRESIVLDGFIDLDYDEWQASELLGVDARSGQPQALYATWDGLNVYLGWDGAWWTLDGVLWAYLDTEAGGTNTSKGGTALPADLLADRAVEIRGPDDGSLWTWKDSAWDESALAFASGPSGDTEVRVPWTASTSQELKVIAFALPPEFEQVVQVQMMAVRSGVTMQAAEPAISPWAVFPTTNALSGTATEDFEWTDTGSVTQVNANQPSARTLLMEVTSPQATGSAWGPGSTLAYAVHLTNPEPTAISNLTIDLTAATGLSYQSQSGATCTTCSSGVSNWTLTVGTLGADQTATVLVTGTLASSLSGLEAVTSTFALSAGATSFTPESQTEVAVTHRVDGQRPTVTLDANSGATFFVPYNSAGNVTFTGSASDRAPDGGAGSGVARAQFNIVIGDWERGWQDATGTQAWSYTANLTHSFYQTFTGQARAIDKAGNIGVIVEKTFTVDTTPPTVTWTLDPVTTAPLTAVSGTVSDTQGLVSRVDVQVDDAAGPWRAAAGPYPPSNGTQGWLWTLTTSQEDGVTHTLRVRAVDAVGNVSTTDWQETLVDTVAPQLSVTQPATSVVLPDDPAPSFLAMAELLSASSDARGPYDVFLQPVQVGRLPKLRSVSALAATPVLTGTVTDGSGVATVQVLVYDPLGGTSKVEFIVTDGRWSYAPNVTGWAVGTYALRVQAVDVHGNVRIAGPYLLEVVDAPIEGLTASNDGPRLIGVEVAFSAAVSAGSNVTYTWTFGDASEAAKGGIVTHAYAESGEYTATVTATNSVSMVMTHTLVTILALGVDAGEDQTANEGAPVSVAATFTDGRPAVTHTSTIDWGDMTVVAGSVDETAFTITGTHAYADNDIYTVTVTVDDGGGHVASDTLQITVTNVAPTAVLTNDGPQNEASPVTVSFTEVQEPGTVDTLTYSFDWESDGTYDLVDQTTPSAAYTWFDNGVYTVTGKVEDDDDGYNVYTTVVSVTNVAPTVHAGEDATIDEGGSFESSGSFTDPGDDAWSATVDYGDTSGVQDLLLTDQTFALGHTYTDSGGYTVEVCVTDDDHGMGCDSAQVTVINVAPIVTASPASQTVQYSEPVATIIFTATDVAADTISAVLSWSGDGTMFQNSSFAGLTLDNGTCAATVGINTCIWSISGNVGMPEGTYTLRLTVTDDDGDATDQDVTLIVEPEEVTVTFDDANDVALPVAEAGGKSGSFTLGVCVSERDVPTAGDISLATVSMSLVPVGPGGPVEGTVVQTLENGQKCVTFRFDEVDVNAYTVQVTVDGGYYTGAGEDVLVVYDPSLGFTTGGGWFYWPDTADEASGYPGDKTNFGFTMKYNKKATNIRGNLLLIRHLADGTIYRVKSNALYGLALGENPQESMGWASFSGKCTYMEPDWDEPIGNYEFMAYVEDRNEPGTGEDRFWIDVIDGLALERPAEENAQEIQGGNLVVPHRAK